MQPVAKQIKQREPAVSSHPPWEGVHPVLQRVYRNREVSHPSSLSYRLSQLWPVRRLTGVMQAAALIHEVMVAQGCVVVVGDFDTDGATSTALAVSALRAMGAERVHFLVPDRFVLGYGLSPELVDQAHAMYQPDLLITVDSGIASVVGVQRAQALGMRVLVTDHHLPGATLPEADCIVNPNLPNCDFPSKHLAGVGVIFYVIMALHKHLQHAGWYANRKQPDVLPLLELVALGTVADVVPLDHNNRILVSYGLESIRSGPCNHGIAALLHMAGRSVAHVQAADLGFAVAPRLNAAGRLDDMSQGVACLLASGAAEATAHAEQLQSLNQQRQAIEQSMQQSAWAHATAQMAQHAWGVCVHDPAWHEGVVGLVASRLKEQIHRPVVVFADTGEPGCIKGSGRSVPGVHMKHALDAIHVRHPDLLHRYGGHAMAVGLTLKADDLASFRVLFDTSVREQLRGETLEPVVWTDGTLEPHEHDLELAWAIERGGPWGQGFAEPCFEGCFEVCACHTMGRDRNHLSLRLRPCVQGAPTGPVLRGVVFQHALLPVQWQPQARLRLVFRLAVNRYRGQEAVQLMVVHAEDHAPLTV